MNPSQIRVLEPFVIVIAMKPWEVTHTFCLAPSLCCQAGNRGLSEVCFPSKLRLFVAKLPLKSVSYSMITRSLICNSHQYADQCASCDGLQSSTLSGCQITWKRKCTKLLLLLRAKMRYPALWLGTSGDSCHPTWPGTLRLLIAQISLYLEIPCMFLFLLPCLSGSSSTSLPDLCCQSSYSPVRSWALTRQPVQWFVGPLLNALQAISSSWDGRHCFPKARLMDFQLVSAYLNVLLSKCISLHRLAISLDF